MESKIPTFAVVGRTNKGKSSLVATLTENDRITVAPTPRTTTYAQAFTYKVNGQPLFALYDTPGFEEAPAILEWLQLVPVAAHERKNRMLEFYRTFHGTKDFHYECELLKPILDGAAILYVADGSHPFRPNFESEFAILQWTGQPSIALLNQIGEGHFEEEWTRALQQYFRAVRTFNTHTAWMHDRIALLDELTFLDDRLAEPLRKAVAAMKRQLDNRLKDAARVVARLLGDSLAFVLEFDAKDPIADAEASRKFFDKLRAKEAEARADISLIFGFHDLKLVDQQDLPAGFDQDLFSKETWQVLGLNRRELMTIGTASGALAGGTIDAMVGGASFMTGTGIGGLLGGLSSAYLAFTDPDIAGFKLGKKKRSIGPYKNPNFPWVLIDRQTAFIQALMKRTHADRREFRFGAHQGPSAQIRAKDKAHLGFLFHCLRLGVRVRPSLEALEIELGKLFATLHR
jgi:hypothetical protein